MTNQQTSPGKAGYALRSLESETHAFFRQRSFEREFDFIVPLLKPGMHVLDCGCGTGTITMGIAEAIAPGRVIGFDQSSAVIEEAQKTADEHGLTNVNFQVGDVLDPGFEDASFEAIVMSGLLQYVVGFEKALEVAHRLLKPGGFLATRDANIHGNWFTGPDSESMYAVQELIYQDELGTGRYPGVGVAVPRALRDLGYVNVQAMPWIAEAVSNPTFWGNVLARLLTRPEFIERTEEAGRATAAEIEDLGRRALAWSQHEDSLASAAEVKAIGWKAG